MKKIWYKFSIDLLIWVIATPLAYLLRLELTLGAYLPAVVLVSAAAIPLKLVIIYLEKFYVQSWHRVGLKDLFTIGRGVLIYTTVFVLASIVLRGEVFIPYSVPLIEAMLLILGLGGARLVNRLWYEYKFTFYRIPRQKINEYLLPEPEMPEP